MNKRIKHLLLILLLIFTQLITPTYATDQTPPTLLTYRVLDEGKAIQLYYNEAIYNEDGTTPLHTHFTAFAIAGTEDVAIEVLSLTNFDYQPLTSGAQEIQLNLNIPDYNRANDLTVFIFQDPNYYVDVASNSLTLPTYMFFRISNGVITQENLGDVPLPTDVIINPEPTEPNPVTPEPEEDTTPSIQSLISSDDNLEIYVAPNGDDTNIGTETEPIQTLTHALQLIRQYQASDAYKDIHIIFREGRYELSETVTFDDTIYNNNGQIVFKNYDKEIPVFSGGRLIDEAPRVENGLYVIDLPVVDDFRQLYTTGTHGKAQVAREPNTGYLQIQEWVSETSGLTVPSTGINFNTSDVEGIEMVVLRSYNQNRIRLSSMTLNNGVYNVMPKQPELSLVFNTGPRRRDQSFYFENSRQFLDVENEYYYDRQANRVYYMPSSNDNVNDFRIIVPQLETLFRFDNADHLVFSGLTFEHSNWNLPTREGFIQRQGGMYYSTRDTFDSRNKRLTQIEPAAITLEDSHHLTFHRNVIRETGANGINLCEGTNNNTFVGNVFMDIGDTAMYIGVEQEPYPDAGKANEDEFIYNNLFYRMGTEYSGSAAIFSTYPTHLVIKNNEIAYSDNMGINMGWLNYETDDTALRDGLISKNYFHHIGNRHDDGGAIHTKNNHPNLLIEKNYFETIRKDMSIRTGLGITQSIYLDNYTTNAVVTRNEFEDVDKPIHLNTNRYYNVINNNDVDDQSIINQAGITSDYADIADALDGICIGTGAPYGLDVSIPSVHNTSSHFLTGTGTIFNYDVENEVVDEAPSGIDTYLANSHLGHVLVKEEAGNKFIELVDNFRSSRLKQYIGKALGDVQGDTVTLSMRIRANTPRTAIYVHFMSGNTTLAKSGLSPINRSVRIWDGEERRWFTSFSDYNTWLNYSIVLDLNAHTYKYIIDGYESPAVALNGNSRVIDAIYIAPEWRDGTFWVDDIQLTIQ